MMIASTAAMTYAAPQMSRRSAMSKLATLAALGAGLFSVPAKAKAQTQGPTPPAGLDHAGHIEWLIGQMTLVEKAGQLNLLGDPFRFRPQNVNPLDGLGDPGRVTRMIRSGEVGNLFNGVGAEAGEMRRLLLADDQGHAVGAAQAHQGGQGDLAGVALA